MSATSNGHGHDHGWDTLAQTPADVDPSRTKTLRRRYAARLRGQFAALNPVIRDAVRSNDLFGLRRDTLQPRPPAPPNDRTFEFATDDEKIEAFMRWLRRQERRGVLEVIATDENTFIRTGYAAGMRHADRALRAEGVSVSAGELAVALNAPIHRDALQMLYTRNFNELEGITEAMNQQISRELADGFARGINPTEMAERITDRIDKIGKTRATTLARTEVIRAHSTATLNRFEELGVGEVTVRAEWTTAGDARVCPICQTLEGRVMTIEEARTETFRFSAGPDEAPSLSGTYDIQPPAHPNCRCVLSPVVS